MALSYDVCVYILCDHPAISFSDRTGQSFQRPCGDRAETAQSSCMQLSCYLNELRTKISRCPYDVLAGSL